MTELTTINLWTRRASWYVRSNSCLKNLWIGLDQLATRRQLTQLLWLELDLILSCWIDHFTPLRYFFLFLLLLLTLVLAGGNITPLTASSIDGRLSKPQPQEFHAFVHLGRIRRNWGFSIESTLCCPRTLYSVLHSWVLMDTIKRILDITSPVGP